MSALHSYAVLFGLALGTVGFLFAIYDIARSVARIGRRRSSSPNQRYSPGASSLRGSFITITSRTTPSPENWT